MSCSLTKVILVPRRQKRGEPQRWLAPQEVITTICEKEAVWAWESRVGTVSVAPPVQFALALGSNTARHNEITSSIHTRIRTHRGTHSFFKSSTALSLLFDTLLSLTIVPPCSVFFFFLQEKPFWVVSQKQNRINPLGLAEDQKWKPDRENKVKQQSCTAQLITHNKLWSLLCRQRSN